MSHQTAVYDLLYPSPATLKAIATNKIVLELWRQEIQKRRIEGTLEKLNFEKSISSSILHPYVASSLLDSIDRKISYMGKSIKRWVDNYTRRNTFQSHVLRDFDDFATDFDGSIDYGKTAKRMILCEKISQVSKFEIACLCCFEDDIVMLWPSVSSQFHLRDLKFSFIDDSLLFYWICRMRNQMYKLSACPCINGIGDPGDPDYSMLSTIAGCCSHFWPSTKYFFNRIDPSTRYNNIRYILLTLSTDYYRYVLSKLNEEELDVFLASQGESLWKFRGPILYLKSYGTLEIWMCVKHKTSLDDFVNLISQILLHPVTYEILSEIWISVPDHFKQSVIQRVLLHDSIFLQQSLLHNQHSSNPSYHLDFLIIALSDASFQDRGTFWNKNWLHFLKVMNSSELHRLMAVCFADENEIIQYKVTVMSDYELIRDYCQILFEGSKFEKLNEVLNFCIIGEQNIRTIQLQLLNGNFKISRSCLEKSDIFNKFINDAYNDVDLATDFKNRLLSGPMMIERLNSSITDGSLRLVRDFIESLFPSEQATKVFKNNYLLPLLKNNFNVIKRKDLDHVNFFRWCLENDDEIAAFKQTLNVDEIVQSVICHEMQQILRRNVRYPMTYNPKLTEFLKWYFDTPEAYENFVARYADDEEFVVLITQTATPISSSKFEPADVEMSHLSDVYDLFYPSPTTLQEIAAIKVAIELWRQEIIKHRTDGTLSKLTFVDNISSSVLNPPAPSAILPIIDKYIGLVKSSIKSWLDYHNMNKFFDSPILENFDDFVGDFGGAIHYTRTAKQIIVCDGIDQLEKFKIACLYCLEEDIEKLWPSVCSQINVMEIAFSKYPQLFYWTCRLRNQLYKIPLPRTLRDNVDGAMLFRINYSSHKHWSSIEYFLNRLSSSRMCCVKNIFTSEQKLFYRYVLAKLSKEEFDEFLIYHRSELWMFICNNMGSESNYAMAVWAYLSCKTEENDFVNLFRRILSSLPPKTDTNKQIQYLEIWKTAADNFKQSVIQRVLLTDSLFRADGRYGDIPAKHITLLIAVLSEASAEDKSTFWNKHWCDLMLALTISDFGQLMASCFKDEDEINRYKETVMCDYEKIGRYCLKLCISANFEKLEEVLKFFSVDEGKGRMIRSQILAENFGINGEHLKKPSALNDFIQGAFEDLDGASEYKNRLLLRSTSVKNFESFVTNGMLKSVREFIDTLISSEEAARDFKKRFMVPIFAQYLTYCTFLKQTDDEHLNFLRWCVGENDDEIAEFKQKLPIDEVIQEVVRKEMKHKWKNSEKSSRAPMTYYPKLVEFLKWYFVTEEAYEEGLAKYAEDDVFVKLITEVKEEEKEEKSEQSGEGDGEKKEQVEQAEQAEQGEQGEQIKQVEQVEQVEQSQGNEQLEKNQQPEQVQGDQNVQPEEMQSEQNMQTDQVQVEQNVPLVPEQAQDEPMMVD